MTKLDDLIGILDMEIGFYRSMDRPPLRERIYCRISRLMPWQDRMIQKLEDLYHIAHVISVRPEKEIDRKALLEALARLEHSQWMEWSKAIAQNECLSPARLKRWQGQLWKHYDELTESDKERDRDYARKVIDIVEDYQRAARAEG